MERARDTRFALLAAVTALAALVPYLNSLAGGYTFDDLWVVVDNPLVQRRDPIAVLTGIYFPGPVYRPFALLTFIANEVVGGNPFGYHAVNVALHVLVSAIVFLLAARLLASRTAALLAALLFALHPVHTEAVASIVGRFELLAAACALGSLLAFARFLQSDGQGRGWYWLSVSVFAIGPFAKENAITAIPMLALVHFWLAPRDPWRRRLVLLLPHAVALAVYLVLRSELTGALVLPAKFPLIDNPLAHVSTAVRVQTALAILWQYTSLLAVPWMLSADYSYNAIAPVASIGDPRLLTAIGGFAALAVVLVALRRQARPLLLGAALAAAALALTSNLPFAIGTMKGERLLYLPSFGWCLALGWLAAQAHQARPSLTVAVVGAVLALYALRTWDRNFDWRDNQTLFAATVATSPQSAKAHHNLGVAYFMQNRYEQADAEFRRALQIYPGYADAAFSIGRVDQIRGGVSQAVLWYERAVASDWACFRAHARLGEVRFQAGEYDTAEGAFRAALEARPDEARFLLLLAATRLRQGASWEAGSLLRRFDEAAWIPAEERNSLTGLRNSIMQEWLQ